MIYPIPRLEVKLNLRVKQGVKMKSIFLKVNIYRKVFVYFFEAFFQYFTEAVGRIFGLDDNSYPAVGVQPYDGDYYSKWS